MSRYEVLGNPTTEPKTTELTLGLEKDLDRLTDPGQTTHRRLEAFIRLFQDNCFGKRMYYRYDPITNEPALLLTVVPTPITAEQQVSHFVAGVRANTHTRPAIQPNSQSTMSQEVSLHGAVVQQIMEYLQKAVPEVFPQNGDTSPSALNLRFP